MLKIKSIGIEGFRGIKDTLTLDLSNKSILLFGENGSGKSSLTDAIEWYYSDGVEHLKSAETGAIKGRASLRNLFIPDNENAFVSIQYSDNKLDAKKTIDSTLHTATSNTTDCFEEYLLSSQSENLILRYRDIVGFIVATPGERLEKLQNIIGFSIVADIRKLLDKPARTIARRIKSANYDNQKHAQQSVVLENLGQNAYSDNQLFTGVNRLIKPLKIEKKIKSHEDLQGVLKAIETKEDTALSEEISFHTRAGENLTEIAGNIDNVHTTYNVYYAIYTRLQKDPDNIQKLQLLNLFREGQSVLKNEVVQDDFCPLCQQDKNKVELLRDINERIKELEELSQEKDRLENEKQTLRDILQVNVSTVDGLIKEKHFKEGNQPELLEKIQQIKTSLDAFSDELKKELVANDTIHELSEIQICKDNITVIARHSQDMATKLTHSKSANINFQIYTKLSHTIMAYVNYQKINREQNILTKQQATFKLLFADFIKRQEEALNAFLNIFSAAINEYYAAINPDEKIDDIRIAIIKDKNDDLTGVKIAYNFFDMSRTPPSAYLSESHINCLGLSFFLASVKAFNKRNGFFVLDDVISSFDRTHRTRFARLLNEKFDDYQILLLTHEQGFFELVGSNVKSKGWLVKIIKWSKEDGAEIVSAAIEIKERILKKFEAKNTDGLGNDIRVYTEKVMKDIACCIEAQVPFKFNEINEKRMTSELLDAVHNRISKKGKDLKEKANIQNLKGIPMFISNVSSHDNEFTEIIEDLAAIWEDIEKTVNIFCCNECEKYISIENLDSVNNKIRCRCGKLNYDWK